MKKTTKKLVLNRETIKVLSEDQMRGAVGAATMFGCGPGATLEFTCNCTEAYTCNSCYYSCPNGCHGTFDNC